MPKIKTRISGTEMTIPKNTDTFLENWSTLNAIFILLATAATFYYRNMIPLVIISFSTFSGLGYFTKKVSSAPPILNSANLITGARFLAVLIIAGFFPHMNNFLIAGLGLSILIADGLDGKLARSSGKASEFGEYFDKETDALFLHVLAIVAIFKNLIWPWLVVLGLLRYLFALFLYLNPKGVRKERRSWMGRYIYVVVILALLSLYVMPLLFSWPAILLAGALLIYSFGTDFIWILTKK